MIISVEAWTGMGKENNILNMLKLYMIFHFISTFIMTNESLEQTIALKTSLDNKIIVGFQ